jgi:DNA repair exonuclease SbcCD ATPase subunit
LIDFLTVRFKNFGSFGNNFSEIKLDNYKTTLVTGTNGHGKSFALLDSLCFGLFGKPFRPINIPQLINTVNAKQCVVEIEFKKSNCHFLVRRGLAPKFFEIFKDGQMLDQNAKTKDYQEMFEENILGFDYAAFKQVVILGKSNFVPFMQLTPSERRKIIEGLLNLDILADMNLYVKGQLSSIKVSISEQESLLKIVHEKIKSQKEVLETIQTTAVEEIKAIESSIQDYTSKIANDNVLQAKHEKNLKDVSAKLTKKLTSLSALKDVPVMLTKAEVLETTLLEEIESLKENALCKCCGQNLPKFQKEKHIEDKESKLADCRKAIVIATKKNTELLELQTEVEELKTLKQKHQSDNNDISYQIISNQSSLSFMNKEKNKKLVNENENTLLQKIKDAELEKESATRQLDALITKQIHHDIVYDILKDGGLKSRIIAHYVPIINGLVNKFLGKLNLYVDFTIDEEFKETIKSRYRDAFSYSSFSEGEKQRIDLAILLTWREVARMKNSLNCNLLIFDEILDSSLDAAGTEAFMKILNKMTNKCSIYIISHKADQLVDKFDQSLQFEKKNNFSKIKTNI